MLKSTYTVASAAIRLQDAHATCDYRHRYRIVHYLVLYNQTHIPVSTFQIAERPFLYTIQSILDIVEEIWRTRKQNYPYRTSKIRQDCTARAK